MKIFISKIASFLLALLVLVSTLSFTVDMHYCGNIMVDKAILSQAKTCGMNQEMPSDEESDCCDDEVKLIKGQDNLKLSKVDFDLDIPLELAIFSFIHFRSTDFTSQEIASTKVYDPPEYDLNFQILHQVFLI